MDIDQSVIITSLTGLLTKDNLLYMGCELDVGEESPWEPSRLSRRVD